MDTVYDICFQRSQIRSDSALFLGKHLCFLRSYSCNCSKTGSASVLGSWRRDTQERKVPLCRRLVHPPALCICTTTFALRSRASHWLHVHQEIRCALLNLACRISQNHIQSKWLLPARVFSRLGELCSFACMVQPNTTLSRLINESCRISQKKLGEMFHDRLII